MEDILELAKKIHPNVSLDGEDLVEKYIEIDENIKKEIDWYLKATPENNAPFFLSGSIGCGKTTLLKKIASKYNFSKYLDIHKITFKDENSAGKIILDILLAIGYDFNAYKYYDEWQGLLENELIWGFKNSLLGLEPLEEIITIDGFDRFVYQNFEIATAIFLDYANIWKALDKKIVFVVPLHYCVESKFLKIYRDAYGIDLGDDNYHAILSTPTIDESNIDFWVEFFERRTQIRLERDGSVDALKRIIQHSGGNLRQTLSIIYNALREQYKAGDSGMKVEYIQKATEKYKQVVLNGAKENIDKLKLIVSQKPNKIPQGSESLFLKEIPLAFYYKTNDDYECRVHPLIEEFVLKSIDQEESIDVNDEEIPF